MVNWQRKKVEKAAGITRAKNVQIQLGRSLQNEAIRVAPCDMKAAAYGHKKHFYFCTKYWESAQRAKNI